MRNSTFFSARLLFSGKWLLSFSFLLIIQLTGSLLFAQTKKVDGFVSDSKGVPLEKVSVVVKGSQSGVTTDSRGAYSITAADGSILVFSFSGYTSQEERVGARTVINVSLVETAVTMEGVVIVGYGSQKKVNLSGAVAQVSGKDLVNKPVPNVTGALQGVLPGVTIIRGNGQPGDEGYGFRIRGFSSANAATAMVLVDGVEQDLNLLDPNDIESISVL